MTGIDELTKRVSTLEETVSHLSTHHDEQFVEIHDESVSWSRRRLQRSDRVASGRKSGEKHEQCGTSQPTAAP